MTKTRKAIILLIISILLISFVFVIVFFKNNDDTISNVQLESLGDENFDVLPLLVDNAGVALGSDFKIICKEEQNLNNIRDSFTIEPSEPYKIKKISDNEYLVDFETELKSNTVYRISMKETESNDLSWAFQTVRSFNLVSTLPRDKGTEVPTNSGIEMQFSYPYIKGLEENFTIEPKVSGKFVYNKNLAVFMPDKLEPNTLYTVTIKSGVGIDGSDMITEEDYSFQFLTQSGNGTRQSYFNFSESLYNYTTDVTPYFQVLASDNLRNEDILVDLYKYKNEDNFISGIKELSDMDYYWRSMVNKTVKIDSSLDKIASFETKLISMDSYGASYISLPNEIEEGYYLINANLDGSTYQTHLQINDAVVYVMLGENESLAWVNDSKTGEAISGAAFKAENSSSAVTNSEGIAIIEEEIVSQEEFEQVFFKVSIDDRPTYVAKMENNYGYQYDYYVNQSNSDFWSYLYLDREIYMLTDTISFWGLVKSRDSEQKIDSVSLHFYKSDYSLEKNEIEVRNISLDEFGCYEGQIDFNELIPGRYYLELTYGEEIIIGKYVEVRNYEKPIYKIDTNFDKEEIFGWETATLNIQANFFEGSPVSGLKLETSFYEDNQSKVINNIVSDDNGFSQIKYTPAIITDEWNPVSVYMNIYNTQAEDQNINTNDSILVFPKNVMFNIDVTENQDEAVIKVQTNMIDINKKTDDDNYLTLTDKYMGSPVNRDIEISIYEISYSKEETGEYYDFINKTVEKTYRYNRNTQLIDTIKTATNNGLYTMNFPLEEGKNYELAVQGNDTRGSNIIQKSYINRYNYYDNYFTTKNYYLEEEDRTKTSYKIGDSINLKLTCNNEEVIEEEGDKLLLLKLKDELKEYNLSENVKNNYIFNKQDIPNYYYSAIYFDGENIYLAGTMGINYDYTEKSLDITAKADKEDYRPGDTVNLEFLVKDKEGNPQKTNLNVSVVDEAIFAISEQNVDIAAAIYKYSFGTGILQDYVSYREMDFASMAERGGDGDFSDYIRSDFEDTTEFKTITTGSNGKASLSFKLPDNLTSWRVTYQGLTQELLVGNGKININSKLPYFITLIKSDTYMEGDNPYISIRSYGTEVEQEDKIEYTVTLESQKGKKQIFKIDSKGNDYANIELGELAKGKYTLTVEGKHANYQDGIKEEFEVVDSMLKTVVVDFMDLDKIKSISGTEGYATINFYNKGNSLFYNTLTSLSYTSGSRVDQQLSRKIASELMSEYFNQELNSEEYQFDKFQIGDGGIALLPYSSSETLLSAKITSLDPELFDQNSLKQYFYNVIADQKSLGIDVASAYWGLAKLNEPVLIEIQNILRNEDVSIKERILLGIGLLEFGDTKGAKEIYTEVMNKYGKKSGEYVYIDTGIDKDDILEATSIMSIMSLKLDSEDKYMLLDYVTHNRTQTILTYLEQLMFVKSDIPNIDQEISFSYILDGKEEDVKITNNERYSLYLSQEQAENIKFKNIDGTVTAAVSYYGNLKESGVSEAGNFELRRTYQPLGKSQDIINQSDVIKITLQPSFSESAPDGYYEITDVLPAGMRYIKGDNRNNSENIRYPIKIDGEKIVFGYYYAKDEPITQITYYVRAVAAGKYTADNAVIINYGSNTMSLSKQNTLIIE
ncbi:MAG: Ig-like domain-containing protein [Vulcanibacillus sp.]